MSADRVVAFPGLSEELRDLRHQFEALKGTDGSGTSGGMEGRVARLESDMSHVKDTLKSLDGRVETIRKDVTTLQVDLGTIKTELTHKPTTTMMWMAAVGIVAALGGIMAAIVRFLPAAT